MASLIFRIVDGETAGDESKYYGKTGVGWVLRFGGLCTLVGQLICYSNPFNTFCQSRLVQCWLERYPQHQPRKR
jgi:hypothetical protein